MAEEKEVVKCMICGEICDGVSAFTHWKTIGHNRWEIILPKKARKVNLPKIGGRKKKEFSNN